MKKFAALILAAVCILSLAACSEKREKEICIWTHDLKAEDITTVSVWSIYGDKQWWIDNDDLTYFVKSVCDVAN